MTFTPGDIVDRIGQLVSLPETAIKLNELLDDPNFTNAAVETLISQDPGLSARVLRIANSPVFAQNVEVDSIQRAIMLLGTSVLRDIVLATSCIDAFAGLENKQVNMRRFWEHSLYSGIVARALAGKRQLFNRERLFLMGLLHDVGELALYQVAGEEMNVVLDRMQHASETVSQAEYKVFGFDHSAVGAELARQWGLPAAIATVIRHHHAPWKTEHNALESGIVHLADNIAKRAGHSQGPFDKEIDFDSKAWKVTGLSEKIIDSIIQVSEQDFNEARMVLFSKKWVQAVA